MTSPAFQHDVGAFITVSNALNPKTVTAGTTTAGQDGLEENGFIIDRGLGAGTNLAQSGKLCVAYSCALTTAKTATIAMNLQHSSSTASTGFSDFDDRDGSTGASVSVTTGASSVLNNTLTADFNLSGAKRYLRAQVTTTLSHTSADTADVAGTLVLGGFGSLPG